MNRVAAIALAFSFLCLFNATRVCGQRTQTAGAGPHSIVQAADEMSDLDLRWIEEALSSSKFSDRQRAMWLLGENSEKTARLVQKAMQSSVPEVAARAQWISRAWQRGILLGEDGPSSGEGGIASRLGSLLDQGRFEAVLFALGITEDREAFLQVKKEVAGLLTLRFSAFAQRAVESQQVSRLVEIIDVVAESRELALCRLQLLQWMEADLDTCGLLPESAKDWDPEQRDAITVLLYYQLGEIDKAIAQARKLENKQLLYSCLILESRWDELADEAMAVAKDSEAGSGDFAKAWSTILIAADRSGNQQLRGEAIEVLSTSVFDESSVVRGMRWKTLAIHGQLDAVFSILESDDPYFSTDIALASSRPERTFGLLGYPLELVDSKYAEWVDQALEKQKVYSRGLRQTTKIFCPEVEKVILLINCLNAVGRDEIAFNIARRLCDRWKIATSGRILTPELRQQIVRRISPVMRKQWIEELVLFGNPGGDPRQLYDSDKSLLADSIAECDITSFSLLLNAIRRLGQPEKLRDQIAAACLIARGKTHAGVDVDMVLESMLADIYKRLDGVSAEPRNAVLFMDNVHRLLMRHGRHELAAAYLRRFADQRVVDAMLMLAEAELSTGRMAKAKEWFAKIENLSAGQKGMGRFPNSESIGDLDLAVVKALTGRWVTARRIGDQTLATSLKDRLDVVLCSPSLRSRMAIADYLREHGEIDLATQVYKAMLPYAALSADATTTQMTYTEVDLYDVVRKYVITIEDKQPSEAARLFDIAVIGMIDPKRYGYRAAAYVSLPLMIQEWQLEAAIVEKNRDQVVQNLQRILELDPLDISFSEEQLPLMRDAGMTQIADDVLDQIMDAGLDYAQRFSHDAMTCNNVAWVAAKNNRRLDDALKLATLAVRSEPESTTYRDTLAEVLFLLGRNEEALQIEQACLLDEPGEWHLHEQIKKFAKSREQVPR